jgi:hypothetical protein
MKVSESVLYNDKKAPYIVFDIRFCAYDVTVTLDAVRGLES